MSITPVITSAEPASEPSARPAVLSTSLLVLPWHDPVVERIGYDAQGRYVETFWLGTLGPTATWLLRRLNAALDSTPDGVEIDLADTARTLGLNYTPHPSNPFVKAIARCQLFGLAQPVGEAIAVRRRIPPLPRRHLAKLPQALQDAHETWSVATDAPAHPLVCP